MDFEKGFHTTRYPARPERTPGVSPGRPVDTWFDEPDAAARVAAACPVDALTPAGASVQVDLRHCVWCQRCRVGMQWEGDYEWARMAHGSANPLPGPFSGSLHVMVVDAGDCGACLREIRQLNNPFYNAHRLGIFFTASPRTADVLLVVGPVSENMRVPLLKAYDAMPAPKRVVAAGTCAITGGVFGRTFMSAGGVHHVLPVDLEVPGDPPPPLAVLHGLLTIAGRSRTADTGGLAGRGHRP